MAKETVVRVLDDLDGSVLDEAGSTVRFGLNGRLYEIDLSQANQQKLEGALAPFIEAGRAVNARTANKPVVGAKSRRAAGNQGAIREWAARNGYNVGGRGRLTQEVVQAYQNAQ